MGFKTFQEELRETGDEGRIKLQRKRKCVRSQS